MPKKTGSYIESDVYAKQIGIEVLELSPVDALCKLKINCSHLNGIGSVHGAVIFSLADITFAVACNARQMAIGMQADIRYRYQQEARESCDGRPPKSMPRNRQAYD